MIRIIYKPIILLVLVFGFFLGYNKLLVDRSLESLRSSLELMSTAESTDDAHGVRIFLDSLLTERITDRKFNSTEVAALEYAQGVMAKGSSDATRALDDAAINVGYIIQERIKEREIERGRLITFLDKINRGLGQSVGYLQDLPATLATRRRAKGEEIDIELLLNAISYDRAWQLQQAQDAYEELVERYPEYRGIQSIKLRLAYIYEKKSLYDKAEYLLHDIVDRYSGTIEARVSERLLKDVAGRRRLIHERQALVAKISPALAQKELQEAYFNLGMLNARLFDFKGAEDAFDKAIAIDPASPLAIRAQFNKAWGYKFQDKLSQSFSIFKQLVDKLPDAETVLNSRYQLADIYHRQEEYEKAVEMYRTISEEYKHSYIAPLMVVQTSTTYLYDLDNYEKAKEEFLALQRRYPFVEIASPQSSYARQFIPYESLPQSWFNRALIEGGMGFAKEVLDISIERSFGRKVAYEKVYTEADLNDIVARMLQKKGLDDVVTNVAVTLAGDLITISGIVKYKNVLVQGSGSVSTEAVRGGIKYTVVDYKFALGDGGISIPIPRLLVDKVVERMNAMLTRKNLRLIVEEITITAETVTIRGLRVGKERAGYEQATR